LVQDFFEEFAKTLKKDLRETDKGFTFAPCKNHKPILDYGQQKKKEIFFRKACQVKKNCYFCTRFERQAKDTKTRS
jgi:hypothetical protein